MTADRIKPHIAASEQMPAQRKFAPFTATFGQQGTACVYHGDFAMVGEVGYEGNLRIAMTVGQRGCQCGCGVPGRALLFTPGVDEARAIAAQLIAACDAAETRAAEAFRDVMARATRP